MYPFTRFYLSNRIFEENESNRRETKEACFNCRWFFFKNGEYTQRWLEYKQEKEEIQYLKDQYKYQQNQDQQQSTTNTTPVNQYDNHDHDNDKSASR
ncbi:MAG TPA: hypothetical protein VFY68_12190 [Nitrososphaeraceae archaeon]|nr:hypothetical protein [Nitrososphaeraceae archaeon]